MEIDFTLPVCFYTNKAATVPSVSKNFYMFSSSSVCSSIMSAAERSFDISMWRGKKELREKNGESDCFELTSSLFFVLCFF